ncbi:uncharacterized protein EV420DRAFT_1743442 [Desarmillaria tabescens]|uniref:Uncharacterized protein n=1 Tax=Armillaria tabescens TaxID=1929756 RepID=A0AA39NJK9_ARMTA|nr:uncharacterized protein EV420DRAFT_1743442 [Desarmillaria tabescens]KAK0466852.1 hypothetical protein EV420DRAFT_1743442 [Desarmillaria tabescens]
MVKTLEQRLGQLHGEFDELKTASERNAIELKAALTNCQNVANNLEKCKDELTKEVETYKIESNALQEELLLLKTNNTSVDQLVNRSTTHPRRYLFRTPRKRKTRARALSHRISRTCLPQVMKRDTRYKATDLENSTSSLGDEGDDVQGYDNEYIHDSEGGKLNSLGNGEPYPSNRWNRSVQRRRLEMAIYVIHVGRQTGLSERPRTQFLLWPQMANPPKKPSQHTPFTATSKLTLPASTGHPLLDTRRDTD